MFLSGKYNFCFSFLSGYFFLFFPSFFFPLWSLTKTISQFVKNIETKHVVVKFKLKNAFKTFSFWKYCWHNCDWETLTRHRTLFITKNIRFNDIVKWKLFVYEATTEFYWDVSNWSAGVYRNKNSYQEHDWRHWPLKILILELFDW